MTSKLDLKNLLKQLTKFKIKEEDDANPDPSEKISASKDTLIGGLSK